MQRREWDRFRRFAAPTALMLVLGGCSDTDSPAVDDGGVTRDGATATGCTGSGCRDFVINRLLLPTATARYAIDLTGDGKIDNEFQTSLSFVQSLSDDQFQTTIDESVLEGDTLVALRLRASDFANATSAKAQLWLAADQTCCQSQDLTACGIEASASCFSGTHTFAPAANSPTDMLFNGKITGGAFALGPATLQIELTMADTIRPILTIEQAQVRGTLSGTTITSGIIAGAFNLDQLLQVAVDLGNATLAEKPNGSSAATIRSTFGLAAGAQLTLAGVRNNDLVKALFKADLPNNRMSIGLGFTAVAAKIDAQ